MINLLPESEQKKLAREYAARVGIVLAAFLSGVLLLGILFLIPAYLSARAAYDAAMTRLGALDQAAVAKQIETARRANDLDQKLTLLKVPSKLSAATVLEKLTAKRTLGISITNISYDRRSMGTKLDVQGVSASREALIGFVKNLKSEQAFAEVYSPVSNLVKDRDINFTISIALVP